MLLIENLELKEEIKELDKKFSQAFKFLLEKIEASNRKDSKRKNIGYNIKKKNDK